MKYEWHVGMRRHSSSRRGRERKRATLFRIIEGKCQSPAPTLC
jgi:hypothetical protein